VSEHRLEVADVFRQYGEEFLKRWGHTVSPQQRKALRDIGACRTATLGGHIEQCDRCPHRMIAYNSCRNRHCPKCQSSARDRWLTERAKELLPVPYCHVIFTVPEQLAPLALQNQRLFYGLLFRAVSQTLLETAADPRHLGAQIGFLAVLHTWSQNLLHHPHVHCVVPAGGIAPDGSSWIRCRQKFFLPVRVLSRLFRGKFLAFLRDAYAQGKLQFSGQLAAFADPARFQVWLRILQKSDWVVYAKPPFGGPEHVLQYLARYTHRVAISNHRLLSVDDNQVCFRWKDYAHHNQPRTLTLSNEEFLRRFLQHVLPNGFPRIRYFGWLANRRRGRWLPICRDGVACQPPAPPTVADGEATVWRCPRCHGPMRIVERLTALQIRREESGPVCALDSS